MMRIWRLSVATGLGRLKLAQGSPRHTWLGHHFQGQKVNVWPKLHQTKLYEVNLQGAGAIMAASRTMHISVDLQRITLNVSCMMISGGRSKQLDIWSLFHQFYLSFALVSRSRLQVPCMWAGSLHEGRTIPLWSMFVDRRVNPLL